MQILHINDHPMQVVRSARRKTLAIKIQHGKVSLHLPKRMPLWLAKQFVLRKQQWITDKLQQPAHAAPQREFALASQHPYLGNLYPLELIHQDRQRTHLQFEAERFLIKAPHDVSPEQLRQSLIRWYRHQADTLLPARAKALAQQIGLHPTHIQIKSYKARWGSCNGKGEIQLNWQLIQAPQHIIDYVIVHELCHLQQANHSPAFWQLVERFDANYREHRCWLKQNGYQLVL